MQWRQILSATSVTGYLVADHLLNIHMRSKHNVGKLYHCNQCKKSFTYKFSLVGHLRRHNGEKPFKCDQCSKAFTHKAQLNYHLKRHRGEKPYQCSQCDKSFTIKHRFGGAFSELIPEKNLISAPSVTRHLQLNLI